jgi:hypothetical protein
MKQSATNQVLWSAGARPPQAGRRGLPLGWIGRVLLLGAAIPVVTGAAGVPFPRAERSPADVLIVVNAPTAGLRAEAEKLRATLEGFPGVASVRLDPETAAPGEVRPAFPSEPSRRRPSRSRAVGPPCRAVRWR